MSTIRATYCGQEHDSRWLQVPWNAAADNWNALLISKLQLATSRVASIDTLTRSSIVRESQVPSFVDALQQDVTAHLAVRRSLAGLKSAAPAPTTKTSFTGGKSSAARGTTAAAGVAAVNGKRSKPGDDVVLVQSKPCFEMLQKGRCDRVACPFSHARPAWMDQDARLAAALAAAEAVEARSAKPVATRGGRGGGRGGGAASLGRFVTST